MDDEIEAALEEFKKVQQEREEKRSDEGRKRSRQLDRRRAQQSSGPVRQTGWRPDYQEFYNEDAEEETQAFFGGDDPETY